MSPREHAFTFPPNSRSSAGTEARLPAPSMSALLFHYFLCIDPKRTLNGCDLSLLQSLITASVVASVQ
jgi:hypothetical protein